MMSKNIISFIIGLSAASANKMLLDFRMEAIDCGAASRFIESLIEIEFSTTLVTQFRTRTSAHTHTLTRAHECETIFPISFVAVFVPHFNTVHQDNKIHHMLMKISFCSYISFVGMESI